MKFSDFDLHPPLLQALDEMGYTGPTPIQEKTIPTLLEGRDVIGCAQTGTGKTAAFALPVLQKIKPGASAHPQALIITPTRELAEQIFQAIQDYTRFMPVRCVAVYGGVPSRTQESALKKGVDIVVATPGRLLDLLQKPSLRLYDVRFLILDEADRMLDMGFIPDVENIVSYVPRTRQTLLFSATMPPEIEKLARRVTRTQSAEMIVIGERSSSADTVTQWICKVGDREKERLLISLLKQPEMTSTIVFTRTKLGCAELSRRLEQAGISAMAIHSNLSQVQRQNALERFKRGECEILVATDIAARGLDIEHISHVVNFDTPTHPEDYVHRVGRTGRALAKGEAYTFVSPAEIRHLKNIEKLINRTLPEWSDQRETPKLETEKTVSQGSERGKTTHKKSAETKPSQKAQETRSVSPKKERPLKNTGKAKSQRSTVEEGAALQEKKNSTAARSKKQVPQAEPETPKLIEAGKAPARQLKAGKDPEAQKKLKPGPARDTHKKLHPGSEPKLLLETSSEPALLPSTQIPKPASAKKSRNAQHLRKPVKAELSVVDQVKHKENLAEKARPTKRTPEPSDFREPSPSVKSEREVEQNVSTQTLGPAAQELNRRRQASERAQKRTSVSRLTAHTQASASTAEPRSAYGESKHLSPQVSELSRQTVRQEKAPVANPQKDSYAARMAKQSPHSSHAPRFFRSEEDVDWLDEE
ncbi:DEAD/DEAH box helicase [bacterium (Candidatus Blackallbacteria) CG17_big_fil_post_rev_8_21_14_2_50_48_46]|uniref:RNA helicase n=1 Tax=bacterium (Candidatus Blackallbacteria) CG17_big_fil_post_rev_8_21_14_2_50_48_46 TaxID=2014261 RepID=A0A2M7G825_9BACT|nr:MAG: DEAD/DEAH box helicase [bacterium (Candidatus Blackallbacteria) CG18_big_fil_WC_8_21_14_2_50_49_26]PIW18224.1 MAG: DEAD/DEAH box helicase [bacterium (Candidatus Blackallbacteria) CG17_big_fil_post_rev_8_21_14_2_50_48_46]PIW50655.1 MAG: DEAD/DEAH box helicase [bacterium (Candidatus Blackallbacteria) CG13_big_fil_rev_8_21_14_2_50_49_14]